MYVCVYVHTLMCMCVRMYVRLCARSCASAYVYAYMCDVCVRVAYVRDVCVRVHVHAYMLGEKLKSWSKFMKIVYPHVVLKSFSYCVPSR